MALAAGLLDVPGVPVEAVLALEPGKISSAPILKGTRLPAQTIVDNHGYGMTPAEIVERFGAAEDQARQILDYARRRTRESERPRVAGAAGP